ncbi:transposase [Paenibacillus andongensis]|uniref:transposase n=1 Tax=Paenibacillus andongensis TaxID=2975482 RepID=UPI0021BBA2E7|nr:transposase [Paenibacillus andongensis]
MELQFTDVQSHMFQTEEECENFLMKMRWSNGFCCPRCDNNEAFKIRTRRLLECKECRMQVSITAGTIMHKSKLSLLQWFRAIQLLLQEGKEYTESSLSHILEINYRSAKLLLQKIQYANLVKENRINLLQKLRESASETSIYNDKEFNEEMTQTNLSQNSPNEWNLRSYLESKINRLNSKLMILSILPKEYQRYLHIKNRSRVTFNNWIRTFLSVYLYPTFLKCYQLSA